MGVDLAKYHYLTPLIEEGALAPIPPSWDAEENGVGGLTFTNKDTGESTDKHPLDDYYWKELQRFMAMSKEEAVWELEKREAQMDNLEDLILLPEEDKKIIDPSDEEIFTCAEMFEVNLI